jgi:hypothetical protein
VPSDEEEVVMRLGSVVRALVAAPCLLLAACAIFPAPTPPAPLAKSEVSALAKCQKTIHKAQLGFVKTKLAALESCVNGVLALRLPFESALITSEDVDAGLVKQRAKCLKSYAKITAASTKLVDAIIKDCTPVEVAIVGAYDALRFQSLMTELSATPPANVQALAGTICAFAEMAADAAVFTASPRMMELLGYLGPEFITLSDSDSGFPNVPLDPRCPPVATSVP